MGGGRWLHKHLKEFWEHHPECKEEPDMLVDTTPDGVTTGPDAEAAEAAAAEAAKAAEVSAPKSQEVPVTNLPFKLQKSEYTLKGRQTVRADGIRKTFDYHFGDENEAGKVKL